MAAVSNLQAQLAQDSGGNPGDGRRSSVELYKFMDRIWNSIHHMYYLTDWSYISGELFQEPQLASGAPFVPGRPQETPEPSPGASLRRANYQNKGKGGSVGGSTFELGSPLEPEGLGNGFHSHNGETPASPEVPCAQPSLPPSQVPVTPKSPAPVPSDIGEGPAAGTAPGKGGKGKGGGGTPKNAAIYESGMYWKFPGLVKVCTRESWCTCAHLDFLHFPSLIYKTSYTFPLIYSPGWNGTSLQRTEGAAKLVQKPWRCSKIKKNASWWKTMRDQSCFFYTCVPTWSCLAFPGNCNLPPVYAYMHLKLHLSPAQETTWPRFWKKRARLKLWNFEWRRLWGMRKQIGPKGVGIPQLAFLWPLTIGLSDSLKSYTWRMSTIFLDRVSPSLLSHPWSLKVYDQFCKAVGIFQRSRSSKWSPSRGRVQNSHYWWVWVLNYQGQGSWKTWKHGSWGSNWFIVQLWGHHQRCNYHVPWQSIHFWYIYIYNPSIPFPPTNEISHSSHLPGLVGTLPLRTRLQVSPHLQLKPIACQWFSKTKIPSVPWHLIWPLRFTWSKAIGILRFKIWGYITSYVDQMGKKIDKVDELQDRTYNQNDISIESIYQRHSCRTSWKVLGHNEHRSYLVPVKTGSRSFWVRVLTNNCEDLDVDGL